MVLVTLIVFVFSVSCAFVPVGASAADKVKPKTKTIQTTGKKSSAKDGALKPSKFESKKLDSEMFEDTPSKKSSDGKSSNAGTGALVRLLFGLAFVVGLIYLVNWLLKRSGRGSGANILGGNRGLIEVVATTPLAQNRALHVVRVGEEVMVVGATDQSINRLGSLDAALIGDDSGFGSVLKERLGIKFVEGADDASAAQRVENENGLQRLIRSMQARTARQ